MCIGSWFQALGPATANARVPKCVTEEETTRSPRWRIGVFVCYWRLWLVDRGRRCTTVPVHAKPCMSADTAWTGRAVGREANEGGPAARAWYDPASWRRRLIVCIHIFINWLYSYFAMQPQVWNKPHCRSLTQFAIFTHIQLQLRAKCEWNYTCKILLIFP